MQVRKLLERKLGVCLQLRGPDCLEVSVTGFGEELEPSTESSGPLVSRRLL